MAPSCTVVESVVAANRGSPPTAVDHGDGFIRCMKQELPASCQIFPEVKFPYSTMITNMDAMPDQIGSTKYGKTTGSNHALMENDPIDGLLHSFQANLKVKRVHDQWPLEEFFELSLVKFLPQSKKGRSLATGIDGIHYVRRTSRL